jgi:hypothetical protein
MPVRTVPSARRLARLAIPAALSLFAVACSDATATDPAPAEASDPTVLRVSACTGPARGLPAELAASNRSAGGFRTVDDMWADLARRTPGGFAGVMYDTPVASAGRGGQGRPILMLTDPARAAEARVALAPHLAGFDVANAEVRAVRWNFAQLYDWYQYVNQTAWQERGITMSDIDEAANRLVYGAADEAARDRLAQRLAALPLPCDLALVKIVPPAVTRPGG